MGNAQTLTQSSVKGGRVQCITTRNISKSRVTDNYICIRSIPRDAALRKTH